MYNLSTDCDRFVKTCTYLNSFTCCFLFVNFSASIFFPLNEKFIPIGNRIRNLIRVTDNSSSKSRPTGFQVLNEMNKKEKKKRNTACTPF